MSDKPFRILLIEDNPGDVRLIKEYLSENQKSSFEILVTERLSDAINVLSKKKFDLILLDLQMPGKSGFQVLQELDFNNIDTRAIVLTAFADVQSAIDAANLGASEFISKPYDIDELLITIRKTVQREV